MRIIVDPDSPSRRCRFRSWICTRRDLMIFTSIIRSIPRRGHPSDRYELQRTAKRVTKILLTVQTHASGLFGLSSRRLHGRMGNNTRLRRPVLPNLGGRPLPSAAAWGAGDRSSSGRVDFDGGGAEGGRGRSRCRARRREGQGREAAAAGAAAGPRRRRKRRIEAREVGGRRRRRELRRR